MTTVPPEKSVERETSIPASNLCNQISLPSTDQGLNRRNPHTVQADQALIGVIVDTTADL
jgi:hypothetical protein